MPNLRAFWLLITCLPCCAQIPTAFVSGAGNDANACTLVSPCRQFVRGLEVVEQGGSVIAVGSGSFKPFFIGKAVTVEAAPGVEAKIVSNGVSTFAIRIQAGGPITVRHLSLYQIPSASSPSVGVDVIASSALVIEDSVIDGFEAGLTVLNSERFTLRNTVVRSYNGLGLGLNQVSPPSSVNIDHCTVTGTSEGIAIGSNVFASISDSVISGPPARGELEQRVGTGLTASGTGTILNLERVEISHYGHGINAVGGATVRSADSVITFNDSGVTWDSTSKVLSRLNNTLTGNVTGNSFTGSFVTR